MTEAQVTELSSLTRRYVDAYFERMRIPEDGTPQLWAAQPIKAEYQAVLAFVRELEETETRYSDESIEKFVDGLLQGALSDHERITEEVASVRAQVEHRIVTRVYIPIDGATIEDPEMQVGAIRLIRIDEKNFESVIMRQYRDCMERNARYSAEDQQAFIKHHEDRFNSLRGRVVAEFRRPKDILQTTAIAYKNGIDQICDFLQYVAALFQPYRETFRVTWASDAPAPILQHAYAVSDDPDSHQNDMTRRIDVLHPFVLTAARMTEIAGYGLLRIADLVDKETVTEYESMLRRAVRWFAKGEREQNPDDRRLCYVTAIDLFFSTRKGGATKNLCKGFAFAMAFRPGAVPPLAAYMSDVFDSRCDTAHEGEHDSMDPEEVTRLRQHTLNLIIRMASFEFTTKAEVFQWRKAQNAALPHELKTALNDVFRKSEEAE